MEIGALTSHVDVAQVVLYAFWIFFAGLIYYLHRENKREGYPLESDRSRSITVQGWPAVPSPKIFRLANGDTVEAPNNRRDQQPPRARGVSRRPAPSRRRSPARARPAAGRPSPTPSRGAP